MCKNRASIRTEVLRLPCASTSSVIVHSNCITVTHTCLEPSQSDNHPDEDEDEDGNSVEI